MEEVKLVTYMSKWPVLANLIFPRHHERRLYGNDFKEKIYFEDRDENEHTAQFLFRYIDMVEQRQEGNYLFFYVFITVYCLSLW